MLTRTKLLDAPRHVAMTALRPLENRLLRRADLAQHGAVFVIGPPRAGSTLFYELLVTRFRFSYISNLAHALYETPAATTLLSRRSIDRWRGRFVNDYGRISGSSAPNEAVRVWRRWIPQEHYLDESAGDGLPLDEIRNTAAAIAQILDAPFLNKNTMHSVHMKLLDRIFPGCLFLDLRRDLVDNVRSILTMRRDKLGPENIRQWWSVRPRGWERHRSADPVIQACAQVLYTFDDIEADSAAIGGERRHVISFESLCDDPESALQGVAAFLESRGVHVEERGPVPERFPRPSQKGTGDLESRIRQAVAALRADGLPAPE